MRHGEPSGIARDPVDAAGMASWVAEYDAVDIRAGVPDVDPLALAGSDAAILCSPMRRAVSSAKRIAQGREVVVLPDAFEAPLPVPGSGRLRLSPDTWLALLRMGWFCGVSGGAERPTETLNRASGIADILEERAMGEGAAVFVGHGILNGFIARVLRRRGWFGPRFPARGYWQSSLYEAPAVQDTRVSA